jgi:hypothetical protein
MNTYKSFSELNDSQKQDIATTFLRNMGVNNQSTVVDYILRKGVEGCDAPFSHSDISNNTPTGQIEINGCYVELGDGDRDEKLEFYERLRDKADAVVDARYALLSDSDDAEYDDLDAKHCKSEELHGKFETICDGLESMDFDTYPEIYQWFECDRYLLDLLDAKGECILDGTYWGRTSGNQSIVLDNVIQDIAYEFYTDCGEYNNHPDSLDFILSTGK